MQMIFFSAVTCTVYFDLFLMSETKWKVNPFIYISFISSMSFLFSFERIISVIPARLAANIFSLIPPTGRTFPLQVISPVIAIPFFTLRFVSADTSAVAIVIPADGPSFGIAPSGT